MSAPLIWILFPIVVGLLLLFISNQRVLSVVGGLVGLLLAVAAQFIPIDTALTIGGFSIRINPTLTVLGRTLLIQPAEGPLLAMIYGAVALWFFGAEAANSAR